MKRSRRPITSTRMANSLMSVCMVVTGKEENFPLEPQIYSSLLHLKRVLATLEKKKVNRTSGELSDKLKQAEVHIIHCTQITEFSDEWKALSCGKPLPLSSQLLGLQPKLADDGLMRSNSRLKHAEFPA